ncbi:MAG: DUF1145 domain-containing protein [Alphaproteobacteria bacterium]|nr:DUF1145 domain-containing protein [Alphaproteobacteria bacterium]
MLKSPPHVLSLIFWAVWLYNFFQPFAGLWGAGVYWLGLVILCVHVAEAVLFMDRIKQADGSRLYHIGMILLFGIFHGRTLPKAA